jgi:hypothetical protein
MTAREQAMLVHSATAVLAVEGGAVDDICKRSLRVWRRS